MKSEEVDRPLRPLSLAGVALCSILAGGFVGGTTNAVNGLVSPTYFVTIMRWHDVENVWRAAIAQGIFEGLISGVLLSLIFTVGTAWITGIRGSFPFVAKHLLGILAGVYTGWILGGLVAMGLASLSPEFYRKTFRGVPTEFGPMLAYAWVGGSIWGAQLGAMLSVVIGLCVLRYNWRRQNEEIEPQRHGGHREDKRQRKSEDGIQRKNQ